MTGRQSPCSLLLGALLSVSGCGGKAGQSTGSAGGGSTAFDGGVSPGTVSITFAVTGTETYCANVGDCGNGFPGIGIVEVDTGASSCTSVNCENCSAFGCLVIVC